MGDGGGVSEIAIHGENPEGIPDVRKGFRCRHRIVEGLVPERRAWDG
jgi:hypothetical protein